MFCSRSYKALAIEVSISEGDCLDGLFAAILLSAADDIVADVWCCEKFAMQNQKGRVGGPCT